MAKQIKVPWNVYIQRQVICEDPEDNVIHPWVFAGRTFAVSETKAINNVRYRVAGNISQYKPVETSGHYDVYVEWKAEKEIRT